MSAPQSWLPFRMNQAVVHFMGFMYLYFVLPYFKKHTHTKRAKEMEACKKHCSQRNNIVDYCLIEYSGNNETYSNEPIFQCS